MRTLAQKKTCLMKHMECTGISPTGYPGFQFVTYQCPWVLHVHFAFITGSGEYLTCSMIPYLTAFVVGLRRFNWYLLLY